MRDKYLKGVFGTCPRALCEHQHVLPIGTSDEPRPSQGMHGAHASSRSRGAANLVKSFCPKCEQVYTPKSKHRDIDGAYFGTSFPQVFLQTYPSMAPIEAPKPFV